jgi:hypothetical protein
MRLALAALLLPCLPQDPSDMTDGQFGPYLQKLTPTSVVVCWRTAQSATTEVTVNGTTFVNGSLVKYHQVPVTGLSPSATYSYACSSSVNGVTVFSGSGTFRTAPAGNEPFAFVGIGEYHDEEIVASFSEEILAAQPLLIVDPSDSVDEGTQVAEWDRYFTIGQAFLPNVPVFCAMGNHTYMPGFSTSTFKKVMANPGNEEWYTWRTGSVQFIALNSTWYFNPWTLSTTQVSWLVQTLQQATDGVDDPKWIVAFFHIPPYSSGPWWREFAERIWVRSFLLSKLEQYGANLVIAGHDKHNEHSKKGSLHIVQLASGNLSPSLTTYNPHKVWLNATDRTIGVFEVSDAKITVKFVSNQGQVLHQFDVTE